MSDKPSNFSPVKPDSLLSESIAEDLGGLLSSPGSIGDRADGNVRDSKLLAMFCAPADSLKLTADKFDVLGPEIAKALKDHGVKEIAVTPNPTGGRHIEAELSKPTIIPQNLAKDGCYQLDIGKSFSADVSKDANGKITIDNIEGMTAKIDNLLGTKKVDATIHKIVISKAADGTTQVDTTGSRFKIEDTKTKYKDAEVYKSLDGWIKKLEDRAGQPKKKTSSLQLPELSIG